MSRFDHAVVLRYALICKAAEITVGNSIKRSDDSVKPFIVRLAYSGDKV